MFREMVRNKQQLTLEETEAVLGRCTNGILACDGDDSYPYAVPLSYVYANGKIYFHSAKTGHKIDAIMRSPKVSFAVVGEDTIVSEEYTSYFRSVVVFGRARIAEGDERLSGFTALVEKYCGDLPEDRKRALIENCERAHIVAIDIDHMTGKEASEYAQKRG